MKTSLTKDQIKLHVFASKTNKTIHEVYEFNSKNYKKSGALSKRATPVYASGTAFNDSEYLSRCAKAIMDTVAPHGEAVRIETPYMFTYIKLTTSEGKNYIVYEDVYLNGNKFPTSPQKLYEAFCNK